MFKFAKTLFGGQAKHSSVSPPLVLGRDAGTEPGVLARDMASPNDGKVSETPLCYVEKCKKRSIFTHMAPSKQKMFFI
jgi:hypothetical protein